MKGLRQGRGDSSHYPTGPCPTTLEVTRSATHTQLPGAFLSSSYLGSPHLQPPELSSPHLSHQ